MNKKKIIILAAAAAVALFGIGIATSNGGQATATAVPQDSTTSSAPVDTRIAVPSVLGLTSAKATATLEAAGFKVMIAGGTNPKFVVNGQSPLTKAEPGTKITIRVGETDAQREAREAAEAKAAAEAEAARVAAEAEAEAAKAAREAKEKAEREAAEAAAAAAADADLSTYAAIDDRTWQLVAKDPAAHVGEKYVIYGGVTQFDSATGVTTFRANTGGTQDDSSYLSAFAYDINTIIDGDAAMLAQIVEDDILKMYVKVTGSYSYDNTMGGGTTAPQVSLHGYELLGHAD